MNIDEALSAAKQAVAAGQLTRPALENLTQWLTEPRYRAYQAAIVAHIQDGKWQKLDDVFWTVIPFGTGGRRGQMYEFGSNAINERTIGESAQGLATYVLEQPRAPGHQLKCAIAYDTRHRSREFAELCASIMVANGFEVYFLDEYRATPQLSYAVRHKQCDCGIMVTASHNPPSDNAVKVYWSTGGQILPPHDKAIIERVMSVDEIQQTDFQQALSAGQVKICTAEIDRDFLAEVVRYAWPGPRQAKIIYSPLHGVGAFAVMPVLEQSGFGDVEVYAPHAEPSGDFPNVPGHVSNPENKAVFDDIIVYARSVSADVILATDPDCDRLGCAAPLSPDSQGPWATLNGNQIGALLTDFVCSRLQQLGQLDQQSYVIKTLVTSELIRRIAASYGVRCEGNLHVGFKWIAGVMDAVGPDNFVFGTEESHGYLIGQYARDKDGASACLLMSLLIAQLKSEGKSLHQRLSELLQQHGCHQESLVNVQMQGSEGMAHMRTLMAAFRSNPPQQLGGIDVASVRDYQSLTVRRLDGSTQPLDALPADMVMLDLATEGNYFAVRPSGTEPKVKFYMFTYCPPSESSDLAAAQQKLGTRLAELEQDIRAYVNRVITPVA
ncbi:MAG: phospho-sugar mutase [Planctomycetales bacterium]|nr:phospho-sugar mutase [Planctomycetales bacterium]